MMKRANAQRQQTMQQMRKEAEAVETRKKVGKAANAKAEMKTAKSRKKKQEKP